MRRRSDVTTMAKAIYTASINNLSWTTEIRRKFLQRFAYSDRPGEDAVGHRSEMLR